MAKKEYFRVTSASWKALEDALGSRKWSEIDPKHAPVVRALVKAGFAEESNVDMETASADIAADLDRLEAAGFVPTVITMPDLVHRTLSDALKDRLDRDGVIVRVQKTATTWRIACERA